MIRKARKAESTKQKAWEENDRRISPDPMPFCRCRARPRLPGRIEGRGSVRAPGWVGGAAGRGVGRTRAPRADRTLSPRAPSEPNPRADRSLWFAANVRLRAARGRGIGPPDRPRPAASPAARADPPPTARAAPSVCAERTRAYAFGSPQCGFVRDGAGDARHRTARDRLVKESPCRCAAPGTHEREWVLAFMMTATRYFPGNYPLSSQSGRLRFCPAPVFGGTTFASGRDPEVARTKNPRSCNVSRRPRGDPADPLRSGRRAVGSAFSRADRADHRVEADQGPGQHQD